MNFSDWYTDRADVYRIVDQSDGDITRSVRVLVSTGVPCRIYQSGKPALTMRDTAAAVTGSDKLMCGLSADIRKGDELRITRPGGPQERYFAGQPQRYPEPFGAVLPGLAHTELDILTEERS